MIVLLPNYINMLKESQVKLCFQKDIFVLMILKILMLPLLSKEICAAYLMLYAKMVTLSIV